MTTTTDKAQGWVAWEIAHDVALDDDGVEREGAEYALIQKVYTDPALRGRGVARQNMVAAIDAIRAAHGGIRIRLWCEALDDTTDTERLAAFYESLGFAATGAGAEMEQ